MNSFDVFVVYIWPALDEDRTQNLDQWKQARDNQTTVMRSNPLKPSKKLGNYDSRWNAKNVSGLKIVLTLQRSSDPTGEGF